MGILDRLKTAASQATDASAALASNSAGAVWAKHGQSIASTVVAGVTQAASQGAAIIADDAAYLENVIDPTWELLPLPVRMIGRERLRWDALFYAARETVFVVDGDSVSVHPEATQRVARLLTDLLPRQQVDDGTARLTSEAGPEQATP
jgi:hypothetical protein